VCTDYDVLFSKLLLHPEQIVPTPRKFWMVCMVDTNNMTIPMQFIEINIKNFGTKNFTFLNAICSWSLFL